ncbi:MAG: dihydroorotate dehydrogenase electron transfer subunit, partial [Clostridia bacterium]|nr:dihydroorotate dehydrogenase electron transfer subunit [Clostridia bacterium]
LLIGGGVGVPPLYNLAKKLIAEGKKVTVILGFNTKSEIFAEKDFIELGVKVKVATADGSYGVKGFVTDAMEDVEYSYFYTCGPEPMFRAIEKCVTTSGQYSFEERMGCGFGACMGCSCKTKYGNKRICKDGPVLKREEIIW